MSIGERIKEARLKNGLTQEQLAALIGVAKSTLTGYEKGNREPDALKINALSKALGVSGDYLLDTGFNSGRDILYISRPSGVETTDELRKRMHDLIDQLDEEDLRLLSDVTIRFRRG